MTMMPKVIFQASCVCVCIIAIFAPINGFLFEKEKCPDDFVWKTYKSNGLCVYVSNDQSDYYQATANCKRRGAMLFSPRTHEKFEVIDKVLPRGDDQYYIGLYAHNSVFTWAEDGSTPNIEYLKSIFIIGSHLPKTSVACGTFNAGPQKVKWADCRSILRFVCEV